MAIHLVTWDLIKDKDYKRLLNRIDQYEGCRPMLSMAIIKTNLTSVELRDDLNKYIDSDDKLMVVQMQNYWGTTFRNSCIEWMISETAKL